MRAVAVSEYGVEPAVTELPEPKAGTDQLLIKIQAGGVNAMDRSIASGAWQAQVPATIRANPAHCDGPRVTSPRPFRVSSVFRGK